METNIVKRTSIFSGLGYGGDCHHERNFHHVEDCHQVERYIEKDGRFYKKGGYESRYPIRKEDLKPGTIVTEFESGNPCCRLWTVRIMTDDGFFDYGYNYNKERLWTSDYVLDINRCCWATEEEREILKNNFGEPTKTFYIKGLSEGNAAAASVAVFHGDSCILKESYYFEDYFLTKKGNVPIVKYHGHVQAELYALHAAILKTASAEEYKMIVSEEQRVLCKIIKFGYYDKDDDKYKLIFPYECVSFCQTKKVVKKNATELMNELRALANKSLLFAKSYKII